MFRRACFTMDIPNDTIIMNNIISSNEHYFAVQDISRTGVQFIRIHMNGLHNSRRHIHVYLWWLSILGLNYPISDNLLMSNIWKKMINNCKCGITDSRGHHSSRTHICIAPKHYSMNETKFYLLASILYKDAKNFGDEYVPKTEIERQFIREFDYILKTTYNGHIRK